jgi:hypothetical protein
LVATGIPFQDGFAGKLEVRRESFMRDAVNMLMLVCASFAAMAFGVLAAYGICRAGFAVLRFHARSVAMELQTKPQVARLT